MPTPNPISPRRIDERAYEKALRLIVLQPLMHNLRRGLSEAAAAGQTYAALEGITWDRDRMEQLVESEVAEHAARLDGYHRNRLIQTFRRALSVDVRPVLSEPAIRSLMDAWRRENVSLIRTIPQRMQDGLFKRMTRTFARRPFDQQALARIVAEEGKVSGYNLRRITRDQTSKAIGQLTQARHRQIGIEEYTWRTAQDERVRDTHSALDGTLQRWDVPPDVGHPGQDIQCRCVAIPYIPEAQTGMPRERVELQPAAPRPEGLASAGFAPEVAARYAASARTFTRHPDFVDYRSNEALRRYTGNEHLDFNRRLRARQSLTEAQEEMREGLRQLYKPIGEDLVTFRGLKGAIPFYRSHRLLQRAPVSSSVDPNVPLKQFSGDDIMIEIHAKAAARAIRTNRNDQFEVIYQDGQHLLVIDVFYGVEVQGRRVSKYVVAELVR